MVTFSLLESDCISSVLLPFVLIVLSQDFERPSTSEDPIFRYLKTIVAWYEAATSIFRRPPRIPISANLVALPDPVIDNVEDCIKTFLDELSQHPLVETKNFPGYLDRRKLAERVQGVTYCTFPTYCSISNSRSLPAWRHTSVPLFVEPGGQGTLFNVLTTKILLQGTG